MADPMVHEKQLTDSWDKNLLANVTDMGLAAQHLDISATIDRL
jgi:hypothetical protein